MLALYQVAKLSGFFGDYAADEAVSALCDDEDGDNFSYFSSFSSESGTTCGDGSNITVGAVALCTASAAAI
jgi:hypothetical protein